MYLFFDTSGTLKEVINDLPLRVGSSNYNEIFAFYEDDSSAFTSATIYYTLDDASTIEAYGSRITKEIPYDAKRDLKFFKYHKDYGFFKFVVPDSVISAGGSVLINITYNKTSSQIQMGAYAVQIDGNGILPDEHISIAQWNYLKELVGSYEGRVSSLETGLEEEIGDRQQGDQTLSGRITLEAQTRQTADNNLQMSLNAESLTRSSSDTLLSNRVGAIEDDYLTEADKTELSDAIFDEESARVDSDDALDERISDIEDDYLKASDKTQLTNTIASNKADIENKVNQDVELKRATKFSYNGDVVKYTNNVRNLKTGATTTTEETIQLANSTNAGLMSPSDVNAIETLQSEVAGLKQQTIRLLYSVKSNPTKQEILAFVQSKGYTDQTKYGGIAVVISATNHIWKWLTDDEEFRDFGLDTINTFTNNVIGAIKGAGEVEGKVYAESDGTGSVYGWDALTDRVDTAENDIDSLDARADALETDSHTHSNKTILDTITSSNLVSSSDRTNWNAKSDFSGDYNDLENKPTIPELTSDLTNDSDFITSSYHDSTKQDTLVSGVNIKKINGESLLGSGSINPVRQAQVIILPIALQVGNSFQITDPTYSKFDYLQFSYYGDLEDDKWMIFKWTGTRNAGNGLYHTYESFAYETLSSQQPYFEVLKITTFASSFDETTQTITSIERTNPVTFSDIVNNLASTDTNKPLSAYQGKVLNEKIPTTFLKSASVSGNTLTLTNQANQTTTFTKPSVINNLTSTSTTDSLSANQGRVLNGKIPTQFVKSASVSSDNKILTLTDQSGNEVEFQGGSDIIDNVTSTATDKSLSANQGKVLNDRINNISSRGRFLALWNASTGLPTTNPSGTPYTYNTGDYFVVSVVGSTNYKPNGSQYTGQPSTTQETGLIKVNDTYYYDGTNWSLLDSGVPTDIQFANISGEPTDNTKLNSALGSKENTSNKVSTLSSSSTNTQYPGAKVVYDSLSAKENSSNKTTSISSASTNTQYPGAKAVYDYVNSAISSAITDALGDDY